MLYKYSRFANAKSYKPLSLIWPQNLLRKGLLAEGMVYMGLFEPVNIVQGIWIQAFILNI